jgi:hypothetical protein
VTVTFYLPVRINTSAIEHLVRAGANARDDRLDQDQSA